MNKIINMLLPPIILRIYKHFKQNRRGIPSADTYGWFGNYDSWNEAMSDCPDKGYASRIILRKVKKSLMKVKIGESLYERDSYLFSKIQYSWPLLAGLLWVAGRSGNKLHVVDFGGSLGTSFYQNRNFLSHLKEVTWNIVEQKHFVQSGKKYFQDKFLKFYTDIDSCLMENREVNVIILSGVIQYLEDPYIFLNKMFTYRIPYLIFDRTIVFEDREANDRLTIQRVPPEIYRASYPCWIFNERKLGFYIRDSYALVADFIAHIGTTINLGDKRALYKGYIYEIKEHENAK